MALDIEAQRHATALREIEQELRLGVRIVELEAEVARMHPVVEAAGPMRDGHEGCVTDPPCGACFRCEFDRAVDAYRTAPTAAGKKE